MGTHDGVQYFIKSSDEATHKAAGSTAIPQAKAGDAYYGISTHEAKSVPACKTIITDLKHGFGLGMFYRKSSNADDLEDTGFYMICNAVDKSIWTTFDFKPYGETSDLIPVKLEYGDPCGELPSGKEKMVIGAMRLFGKD